MRELIYTPRLVLRDITEQDAGRLYELDSDPEVMRYIGSRAPADVAVSELSWLIFAIPSDLET